MDYKFTIKTTETCLEYFFNILQADLDRKERLDPLGTELIGPTYENIRLLLPQVTCEPEFVGLVQGIYMYLRAAKRSAIAYCSLPRDQRGDMNLLAMKKVDVTLPDEEESRLWSDTFKIISVIYYELTGTALVIPAGVMDIRMID